jgi:hypothetical protein
MNLRSRKTTNEKEIIPYTSNTDERVSRSPKKKVTLSLNKDRSKSPNRNNKSPRNNKTKKIDDNNNNIENNQEEEEEVVVDINKQNTTQIKSNSSTETSNLDDRNINIGDDYNLKEIKDKILRALIWNERYIKYESESHHEWIDRIIGYQKVKLNKIRIRIPTYACYIMVCLGIGILFTCHMLQGYGVQIEKSSLFTYRCHDVSIAIYNIYYILNYFKFAIIHIYFISNIG